MTSLFRTEICSQLPVFDGAKINSKTKTYNTSFANALNSLIVLIQSCNDNNNKTEFGHKAVFYFLVFLLFYLISFTY